MEIEPIVHKALKCPKSKEFKHEDKDGGTMFYNAVLFAAGDWTDSASMQEVRYTKEEIGKSAKLWDGAYLWGNMHNPDRSMTDHLGKVTNPRMDDDKLLGDLFLHGNTQASRDAIDMWKARQMPDLSAEMTTLDVTEDDVIYAKDIQPYGVAWVDVGACDVCKVNMRAPAVVGKAFKKLLRGEAYMPDEELVEKLEDLVEKVAEIAEENMEFKKRLQDLEDERIPANPDAVDDEDEEKKKEEAAKVEKLESEVKDMRKAFKEVESKDEAIKELQAQIKKLADVEHQRSQRGGGNGDDDTKPISQFKRDKSGTMNLKVVG